MRKIVTVVEHFMESSYWLPKIDRKTVAQPSTLA